MPAKMGALVKSSAWVIRDIRVNSGREPHIPKVITAAAPKGALRRLQLSYNL